MVISLGLIGLSYTRLRELVLEAFEDIVPDIAVIILMVLIALGVAGQLPTPKLVFQIVFLSGMAAGLVSDSAKDSYVKDSLSSRLSLSQALGLQFLFFFGFPGAPLKMGYSWPRVFPLGARGHTGRFLTQLLFQDYSFRFLYEFGCMLQGLFCKKQQ